MKALAKRLEDRYQSAAAMRSDIERYLAGRPVQAPVAAPGRDPTPAPAADDTSTTRPAAGAAARGRTTSATTTTARAAAHQRAGPARRC